MIVPAIHIRVSDSISNLRRFNQLVDLLRSNGYLVSSVNVNKTGRISVTVCHDVKIIGEF